MRAHIGRCAARSMRRCSSTASRSRRAIAESSIFQPFARMLTMRARCCLSPTTTAHTSKNARSLRSRPIAECISAPSTPTTPRSFMCGAADPIASHLVISKDSGTTFHEVVRGGPLQGFAITSDGASIFAGGTDRRTLARSSRRRSLRKNFAGARAMSHRRRRNALRVRTHRHRLRARRVERSGRHLFAEAHARRNARTVEMRLAERDGPMQRRLEHPTIDLRAGHFGPTPLPLFRPRPGRKQARPPPKRIFSVAPSHVPKVTKVASFWLHF